MCHGQKQLKHGDCMGVATPPLIEELEWTIERFPLSLNGHKPKKRCLNMTHTHMKYRQFRDDRLLSNYGSFPLALIDRSWSWNIQKMSHILISQRLAFLPWFSVVKFPFWIMFIWFDVFCLNHHLCRINPYVYRFFLVFEARWFGPGIRLCLWYPKSPLFAGGIITFAEKNHNFWRLPSGNLT